MQLTPFSAFKVISFSTFTWKIKYGNTRNIIEKRNFYRPKMFALTFIVILAILHRKSKHYLFRVACKKILIALLTPIKKKNVKYVLFLNYLNCHLNKGIFLFHQSGGNPALGITKKCQTYNNGSYTMNAINKKKK